MRDAGILLFALFLVATAMLGTARSDLDGQLYRSTQWRVSLEGPKGWQLSEHSSYPSILLWMTHRRPSARILLTAETVGKNMTSHKYALRSAKKLKALGFRVRTPQVHSSTGAYWMDLDNGKSFLRQALLVPTDSRIGYSITLSSDTTQTRGQLLRAFDFSLRSLKPKRD